MKSQSSIKTACLSVMLSGLFNLPAHSALITYSGVIEQCVSVCDFFTAAGERFEASFIVPDGAGIVDRATIYNEEFALFTPEGDSLEFLGATPASTLLLDNFNNVIGGTITLASNMGRYAEAIIDFSSNSWQVNTGPTCDTPNNTPNCITKLVASGSGVFTSNEPSPVPLPATAWFFVSALGGLMALRKKQ